MNPVDDDDPFSPHNDPDRLHGAPRVATVTEAAAPARAGCQCAGAPASPARRQALLVVGALAALPVAAAARPFPVPCVQDTQKIKPCRHRYCRHFGGGEDYYGR